MADLRQAGSLWTPEEDVILLRHVAKYGTKHWGYLQGSGVLPHRDQKACCNRFILLKRKFFQARAKGQRLTFPVSPHLETSSSLRSAPASLERRSAASSNPKLSVSSPTTAFKRPAAAGPLSVPCVLTSSAVSHRDDKAHSSVLKENLQSRKTSAAGTSSCTDFNPQPRQNAKQEEGPLEAFLNSMGTAECCEDENKEVVSTRARTPQAGDILCNQVHDVMPALVDAPQTLAYPAVPAVLPPTPETLNGSQGPAVDSAMPAVWKCFNPSVLPCPSPSEQRKQNAFPVEEVNRLPVDLTQCRSLSPDALLEQIAATPVRMLFGEPPSQDSASAFDISSLSGGIWDLPASADLFDVLKSAASI